MRKNIFNAKKLTLTYIDKRNFMLLKDNNPVGRKYDLRAAYNLAKTIQQTLNNPPNDSFNFHTQEFYIQPEVKKRFKQYEQERLEERV